MNRAAGWAVIVALVALTVAGLVAPLPLLLVLAILAVVMLRRGRVGFLVFFASTVALNTLLLALLIPGAALFSVGAASFSEDGARRGFVGALRIVAVTGANLAILSRISVESVLDAIRLPPRPTAFLAALLIAAHDVGRDFARMRDAQRLSGEWPRKIWKRASAAARLLPGLMVIAVRRAETRRDALRLAGHAVGPGFAPLVAVSALAVAGRMALLALPNISLAYVVVFLGGLLFGWRVGALAGLISMAFTDLLLTGFLPVSFANAPAMALVGVLGAAVAPLARGTSATAVWAGRLFAASAGLGGTFLFSVTADVFTWVMVPEYRGSQAALLALVLRGLAFNVVPGIVNAVLFAAAVGPVQAAFRALRSATMPATSATVPATRATAPPPPSA